MDTHPHRITEAIVQASAAKQLGMKLEDIQVKSFNVTAGAKKGELNDNLNVWSFANSEHVKVTTTCAK